MRGRQICLTKLLFCPLQVICQVSWRIKTRYWRYEGLKDPTARRQRERRLKDEFAFFQSLSRLFLPTYFASVGKPSRG